MMALKEGMPTSEDLKNGVVFLVCYEQVYSSCQQCAQKEDEQ